jgi:hypothetical protein
VSAGRVAPCLPRTRPVDSSDERLEAAINVALGKLARNDHMYYPLALLGANSSIPMPPSANAEVRLLASNKTDGGEAVTRERQLLAGCGPTRTSTVRRANANDRFQARRSKAAKPAVDPERPPTSAHVVPKS